jgi:hypothetical protein
VMSHYTADGILGCQQNTGVSVAPLGRWEDERSPDDDDLVQIMLVAGACNQRYLQLWSGAA